MIRLARAGGFLPGRRKLAGILPDFRRRMRGCCVGGLARAGCIGAGGVLGRFRWRLRGRGFIGLGRRRCRRGLRRLRSRRRLGGLRGLSCIRQYWCEQEDAGGRKCQFLHSGSLPVDRPRNWTRLRPIKRPAKSSCSARHRGREGPCPGPWALQFVGQRHSSRTILGHGKVTACRNGPC